jgi:signal transduction histidine kinase
MRLLPRSLTGRLLVTAAFAIAAALVLASLAIGHVLERFVMHGLDERLDAQVSVLARAVRPDGSLDAARVVDVPPFDAPGSGWAWEVIAPAGTLRSGSLGPATLPLPSDWDRAPRWPPHRPPWADRDAPRPFDGQDAQGAAIHYRILRRPTAQGVATILATGPRSTVERPLRAAMVPLLVSLLLLAGFLAVALIVQLRIGLRPLERLAGSLAEVRGGRSRLIEVDEPRELLPLVEELNALIAVNDQALAHARGHVANLAHGLKTPLATLRIDLADPRVDPEGRLGRQVARMEEQIRHHLGRARAAEPGAVPRAAVPLAPCVSALLDALARIHADRGIAAHADIADDLAVRCDSQDLDELLGNLLDNGWRWARSTVRVSAARRDRMVELVIADDGPGMADADIHEAMIKGRRLDEREAGHGFGLAISRELAELHGGGLALARSGGGGLQATVRLPAG